MKLSLLLCWLGIHRYKIIDVSFGFGQGGSVKTVECKICKIKKTKKGIKDRISTEQNNKKRLH